jgi:aminotransferase
VGVSEALDLAIRALVIARRRGDLSRALLRLLRAVVTFAHGTPVAVRTSRENGFRLTRELVEPHVTTRTRALLLNFPTNPTGAVLRREDVEGLAALAAERDLVVITDDIYSELTYGGSASASRRMPGMKERTIFLNGFSKAWAMTGFRLGSPAPRRN